LINKLNDFYASSLIHIFLIFRMSNWLATDESDSIYIRYTTLIIYSIAAIYDLTLFGVFQPMIDGVTTEAPMIVPIMLIPTIIVVLLYG